MTIVTDAARKRYADEYYELFGALTALDAKSEGKYAVQSTRPRPIQAERSLRAGSDLSNGRQNGGKMSVSTANDSIKAR